MPGSPQITPTALRSKNPRTVQAIGFGSSSSGQSIMRIATPVSPWHVALRLETLQRVGRLRLRHADRAEDRADGCAIRRLDRIPYPVEVRVVKLV